MDDIKKFKNSHTTNPGTGTVYVHNFIEFLIDKKTFTIYKHGTKFRMLQHFDTSFKVEDFEKCLIKVKKLDHQGFLNLYNICLVLCINKNIFLLLYHSFDLDCTKPMGFICADFFENPCSQMHSTHVNFLKAWSHYVYKTLIYEGILQKEADCFIHSCQDCGYALLCALAQRFHYLLIIYLLDPIFGTINSNV